MELNSKSEDTNKILKKELGHQYILDLFECDEKKISDPEYVKETMEKAAKEAGANIVKVVFHEFSPHGISGVVVIAESHFALHTWPEHRFCAADLFTCGETVDYLKAFDILKESFGAKRQTLKSIKRGL